LRVFDDAEQLKKLNQLVHPRVAIDYKRWVDSKVGAPYVLKEAALLFEAGSNKQLDKVIVVHAPESIRVKRVLKRDRHRTEAQIKSIVKNQMPEEEKLKKADFIVRNDETVLLIPQVLELHTLLCTTAGVN
jgi:dephospho-CoA kinase